MSVPSDRHIRVFLPRAIVSVPNIDTVDALSGVLRGRCTADQVKTVGHYVERSETPGRSQRYRFQPPERPPSINRSRISSLRSITGQ